MLGCRRRKTDYYIIQTFTKHASFRIYSKGIGKHKVDDCLYCKAVNTAKHTIFRCLRWKEEIDSACEDLDIVFVMLEYSEK